SDDAVLSQPDPTRETTTSPATAPRAVDAYAKPNRSGEDEMSSDDTTGGASAVSRGTKFRTAADIAATGNIAYDDSTPLARAAEHVVMARHGQLGRNAPPRPERTRVMVVAN